MKIYIAGKITGDKNYREKFKCAFFELKDDGHTPMNPACLPSGFEHHEYMRICYAMIDVCDAVFFLNDWKESKGALMEMEYAKEKEKKIYFERQ